MPWRGPLVAEGSLPSMKPTRKLSYAAATAVVLFVVSLFVDVDENTEQAVNVGLPLVLAYFVKNDDTPGGVPPKS